MRTGVHNLTLTELQSGLQMHMPQRQALLPGTVTKSVERGRRMPEIQSLVPSQVKAMTFKIYTCRFLAWCLALIG